jgi:tRNA nucleotidyltransferase (CCA-adding enzyme)
MARDAQAYPQVRATAADLVDGAVVAAPPSLAARDGSRLARRRHAEALQAGEGMWVLREDLVRAEALGVGELPIRRLARPLPAVAASDSEVLVRRHLSAGAPAVIVGRGRALVGLVRRGPAAAPLSMQARVERWLDAGSRTLLASIGGLAATHGARAFVVGGLVRDLWLERGREGRDLDVVVEGDARVVARALAAALGGTLIEHDRFLTASIALADARRVDVVTARTERYDSPGALPRVMPASITQDLRRRDFTVNAMAIELGSGAFGLLDPLGGAADVARRRLRILHPLSFVEDPTRIFRAARYAARLGFSLDAWSARCRTLALERGPYPALSPARLVAELEHILAEPEGGRALASLARAGAFRLLDPRHRATRTTVVRLEALPATLAWARARGFEAPGLEVLAAALAADQPVPRAATLAGLGLRGAPLARVQDALAARPSLADGLAAAERPSEAARLMRAATPTALAWAHLAGDAATRERLDRTLLAAASGRPVLGGEELLALGVARGPGMAELLGALRDARLDGVVRDRQAEIDYVKARLANRTTEEG